MKLIYLKKNLNKKYNLNLNILNRNNDKFEKINNYDLLGYTYDLRDYTDPFKKQLHDDDYIIKEAYFNNKPVYYFNIELFFEEKNIIQKTFDLLKHEFKEFLKKKTTIIIDDKKINKYRLKFENESYTILNLLSIELRKKNDIIYSVYDKEHPLDKFIFLEFITKNPINNYYNILHQNVNEIIKYIDSIQIF
jgi:DNA-directed RNA polymerase subunit L